MPSGAAGKTDVGLSDDAIAWLDEVQGEIPATFGVSVQLRAWLRWDPEPRGAESVLAVLLGSQRMGQIVSNRVAAFVPVMNAAAFREELPVVRDAVLRRRTETPRYVLTLPEPSGTDPTFADGSRWADGGNR